LLGTKSNAATILAIGDPVDKDAWIDEETNDVYFYSELDNQWFNLGPISGPQGPQGFQGIKGEPPNVEDINNFASSYLLTNATVDFGVLPDTYDLYENTFQIIEQSGSAWTFEFTFTNVERFNRVRTNYRYFSITTGGHVVNLEIYNYVTTTWTVLTDFGIAANLIFQDFPIVDTDYIDNGEAKVRFRHLPNGNENHRFALDYLALVKSFAGSAGAQGVQGAQGFQGVQGAQGAQGVQGAQGAQGVQGAQGAQGFQGVQGAQGAQGFQGVQGAQGFQGVQGAQGAQGFQGVQGAQGAQGFQGVQGAQGAQGFQGVQGAQGFQGVQGAQGAQGFQGVQGAQGAQGFQGIQGAQGFQGVQGAQGAQGAQGFQGIQGAQGFQGVQGEQGASSTVPGPQGAQGVQGAQGEQGFIGDTSAVTASILFQISNDGAAITTGIKGDLVVPFNATITEWSLLADQTGSVVVDIWKDTYGNYPPTVDDSITGSAKPTITSSNKGQSSTLTGWTTTVTAGDILRFNIDSVSTIERLSINLKISRT
jgi:hypothetical protein